jgi:hypothetical protein
MLTFRVAVLVLLVRQAGLDRVTFAWTGGSGGAIHHGSARAAGRR